ncbi:MAG: hypothetical protein AB7O57_06820 [Hyphomicrobiaceae bacterium]
MNALQPAAAAFYDTINGAATPDQLDNLGRAVWHHWGKGEFSDDEAQFLAGAIDKRRPMGRRTSSVPGSVTMKPVGRLAGRLGSIFPRRRPQRSPDRKASRERQRMLGGAGHLPPQVRQHYTQGERAVLYVISTEVKRTGVCDWPIAKIAAMAGVCRTTAQNAMREAQRLAHIIVEQRPVPGKKNLTNVVKVISREWCAWLKRGPIGFKMLDPTKIIDIQKEGSARAERPQGAIRGEYEARSGPPRRWEWRRRA